MCALLHYADDSSSTGYWQPNRPLDVTLQRRDADSFPYCLRFYSALVVSVTGGEEPPAGVHTCSNMLSFLCVSFYAMRNDVFGIARMLVVAWHAVTG